MKKVTVRNRALAAVTVGLCGLMLAQTPAAAATHSLESDQQQQIKISAKKEPHNLIEGPTEVKYGDIVTFSFALTGKERNTSFSEVRVTNAYGKRLGQSQKAGGPIETLIRATTAGPGEIVVTTPNGTYTHEYVVTLDDVSSVEYIDGSGQKVGRDGAWTASVENTKCLEPSADGSRQCVAQMRLGGDYSRVGGRPILDNELLLTNGESVKVDVEASKSYATYFAGAYEPGVHTGDCSGLVFASFTVPPGAAPDSLILKESPADPGVVLPLLNPGLAT